MEEELKKGITTLVKFRVPLQAKDKKTSGKEIKSVNIVILAFQHLDLTRSITHCAYINI